jgi:hypothetical protein
LNIRRRAKVAQRRAGAAIEKIRLIVVERSVRIYRSKPYQLLIDSNVLLDFEVRYRA